MKNFLVVLALFGFVGQTFAEETVSEKAVDTAKDAKRAVKKSAHRMKEAVCRKDDAKCMAEKSKHRVEEMSDATKDKAAELKNDVDKDKK